MEQYIQTHMVSYQARIEAILFAYGDPMPVSKLAEILGIDKAACWQQMEELQKQYQRKNRGIELIQMDDHVQLCTKKAFAQEIKKAIAVKRDLPLSPVSMEVLAIIAYNQPVTKGFIEQVRGVNSGQIVNNLVEKGLVEEAGRLDIPGRPISYRTTDVFLRTFDLKTLDDLPAVKQLEETVEQE